jgi:DNA polymerase III subunit delta'
MVKRGTKASVALFTTQDHASHSRFTIHDSRFTILRVSFSTTIGHRRIASLLSRAVAHDTLPPSLLLAGPAGIGKRRVAMAIATALNCLQPRQSDEFERDGCGACAACKRIERGVHPDVIVIEPGDTGTIKIEQVRDVIDRAGYRPFEGRRRVVVIDEADAMVPAAQNALLKTLEEPPSASIFILVSSMPDSLLPTVRSRCPRLRFGPLLVADVAEVLVRDHGYTQSEARVAAADADGSVGRALSAESADLADARAAAQRILEQASRTTDPARLVDSVKDVVGKKGSSATERDQLAACLRAAASLLRDLGLMAARADTSVLANTDLQPQLTALSRSYDGDRASRAYAAVDQALAALERNASPKLVVDWLVLQI